MPASPAFAAALMAFSPIYRDTALEQARQGHAVVPCHQRTPHGCTCGRADCASPGAHPLLAVDRATCDQDQIRSWWATWSGAAVGIVEAGQLRRVLTDPTGPHRVAPAAPGSDVPQLAPVADPAGAADECAERSPLRLAFASA